MVARGELEDVTNNVRVAQGSSHTPYFKRKRAGYINRIAWVVETSNEHPGQHTLVKIV